ncbi:Uncharacterised protein [Moraxella lacunata]|uniref:Uncharacterized protein n=1 Tax=Moraxella lacunata TaxID=477 RepID=A0A1B8Q7Z3_MORLA|nr:hypothetical protein [Moraxella lacunata]OBX59255.1 hypothetical protein A9Z63_01645 [Moraxella lacunata]OBX66396.1 hypothetical protein A9309_01445 [Moraxella lacunata]OPH38671.1 hypothetical protein B5J94_02465 [Moraxella lacunata]STZ01037.1 Uncharacterised protein [Moraxella lacunata]
MPAFCICNENHEKSHAFQGKSSFDSRSIKRAFDFESQDLAIFHAKTISLSLKYFYIANSVIKGRHALVQITNLDNRILIVRHGK